MREHDYGGNIIKFAEDAAKNLPQRRNPKTPEQKVAENLVSLMYFTGGVGYYIGKAIFTRERKRLEKKFGRNK